MRRRRAGPPAQGIAPELDEQVFVQTRLRRLVVEYDCRVPDALYFTDEPGRERADREGSVRAADGVRDRPAGAGAEGVRRAARAEGASRHARPEEAREARPRAGVPREAGDPPVPGLDGRPRAGARRRRRRGLRRRRLADLERGSRLRRPEEAARLTPRLRPDEGDGALVGARATASASTRRSRSSRTTHASARSTPRRRSPTTRPRSEPTRPHCAPARRRRGFRA